MSAKKSRRQKKKSIEDIYRNNDFEPPKEQNLETIFEEPRKSKEGLPILTSVKKYKRYLHFDPTQNKIQKRKRKAKKCLKKLKSNYRITRSSPQSSNSGDISMYFDCLSGSSSDSDMEASPSPFTSPTFSDTFVNTERRLTGRTGTLGSSQDFSDVFDTPKRPRQESQLSDEYDDSAHIVNNNKEVPSTSAASVVDVAEPDAKSITPDDQAQSPRRSCIIS